MSSALLSLTTPDPDALLQDTLNMVSSTNTALHKETVALEARLATLEKAEKLRLENLAILKKNAELKRKISELESGATSTANDEAAAAQDKKRADSKPTTTTTTATSASTNQFLLMMTRRPTDAPVDKRLTSAVGLPDALRCQTCNAVISGPINLSNWDNRLGRHVAGPLVNMCFACEQGRLKTF